jgi:hypothetical protein
MTAWCAWGSAEIQIVKFAGLLFCCVEFAFDEKLQRPFGGGEVRAEASIDERNVFDLWKAERMRITRDWSAPFKPTTEMDSTRLGKYSLMVFRTLSFDSILKVGSSPISISSADSNMRRSS